MFQFVRIFNLRNFSADFDEILSRGSTLKFVLVTVSALTGSNSMYIEVVCKNADF